MPVETSGLYTVSLWMREDGLRIDRLLLTTDTTFIPTDFGPLESARTVAGTPPPTTLLTRTIVYTYDNLYRLTNADYSTHSTGSGQASESYAYEYDEVGNRLQQIINNQAPNIYVYDDANRLATVDGSLYSFDANGNLETSDTLTNTWDAANRLVETQRNQNIVQPIYNGVNDRVGQTVGITTTHFALDIAAGLPEVIASHVTNTSEGNTYPASSSPKVARARLATC